MKLLKHSMIKQKNMVTQKIKIKLLRRYYLLTPIIALKSIQLYPNFYC